MLNLSKTHLKFVGMVEYDESARQEELIRRLPQEAQKNYQEIIYSLDYEVCLLPCFFDPRLLSPIQRVYLQYRLHVIRRF